MTTAPDEIRTLESELKELGKRLAKTFEPGANAAIWAAIDEKRKRLGKLLLARDKQERPEIYRGSK